MLKGEAYNNQFGSSVYSCRKLHMKTPERAVTVMINMVLFGTKFALSGW
ncbi:MAG: hypothetical protein QW453_07135 [Thermoprotei archaeon]